MNSCRKNETASDNTTTPGSSTKTGRSSKQVTWAENLVTIYIYPAVWESDEHVTIVGEKRNKKRNQRTSKCPIDMEYVFGTFLIFGILIFLVWYLSR